ncbi:hypothetical protein KK083_03450 [Fulvivirgaceae bacterium PWU4]|uniref:Uncharacterized protein n=1 Tax=Chryseosolibacter histidini TaxID=2782349 RepID=A0AAP2GMY2_9BACT|nr:hypothetical protein [Chryseosolibacter histidini]MBT1695917.1 hypothetical protein [Chryseosolibacter histidini]
MKRTYWIFVIIVIAIVIGIGIGIYLSEERAVNTPTQEPVEGKLAWIKTRIKGLETRIKSEIAALKLTNEMEAALNRKVDRLCLGIGTLFLLILIGITALFYCNGLDLLTAILSTAGLASLFFPLASVVFWRTVDFDFIVTRTRGKVKSWLNEKYGHNPDAMIELSASIAKNSEELDKLVIPSIQ